MRPSAKTVVPRTSVRAIRPRSVRPTHGLCATVNSDDPAYFGGYVGENLAGVANALKLDDGALVQLARNSFEAAFLDDAARARHLAELDAAHS